MSTTWWTLLTEQCGKSYLIHSGSFTWFKWQRKSPKAIPKSKVTTCEPLTDEMSSKSICNPIFDSFGRSLNDPKNDPKIRRMIFKVIHRADAIRSWWTEYSKSKNISLVHSRVVFFRLKSSPNSLSLTKCLNRMVLSYSVQIIGTKWDLIPF